MTIIRIEEGELYSQAIVHGDFVYLAGQVGDPVDSLSQQARQAFAKIDSLLEHAGSDRGHLLRGTILLADMADYDSMNKEWDAWLNGIPKPVRATYGVGPASPRYAIEVIATAARPAARSLPQL